MVGRPSGLRLSLKANSKFGVREALSNRKLFCFGYYFPPSRAPEAIVSAKRTVGLRGWDVTFTAFQMGEDDQELANYANRNFHRIVRLVLPWWVRVIPKRILTRLPMLPDWLALVTKYAVRDLKSLDVSEAHVFMTCSQSHSSHLVGLEVKKSYPELPWVAHFSDPWANNPYLDRVNDRKKAKERELEAKVFHNADLLIFTSEETRAHIADNYPHHIRSKMRVLPHAFDPNMREGGGRAERTHIDENMERIVVRHIGALYGKRSPIAFFEAIASLLQEMPELINEISFEFIGPIDAEFRIALEKLGLSSRVIALFPPVSYLASLKLMQSADALLVIDAPSNENIFLPSKLIDYIGIGKPILALSSPGTTRTLVREYGGRFCEPNNVQKIVHELRIFLTELREGGQSRRMVNDDVRSRFHVDCVGKLLQSYLNEVISESTE